MIKANDFERALGALGFSRDGDVYEKRFPGFRCAMRVDFAKRRLIYPEAVKGRERNVSFDAPENFVVFECVHRLLEKGYRPEDIELEKEWRLGHEEKGGRADICVSGRDGSMLAIIECKTAGREFKRAWEDTLRDGGQLFSYWQQERSAKWLVLYASDLKDGAVRYEDAVIDCSDEPSRAKAKGLQSYVSAFTAEEKHLVWREVYGCQTYSGILFSEETVAYQVGVKPLLKKDLRRFQRGDRLVNRFEEILRHNNVSDKENAFNRLIALFICKLADESSKGPEDEVEFQYKWGTDDDESLQDRLQRLHMKGMEEFMREEISYVRADYPERLFAEYRSSQRHKAIEDLRGQLRILKFFSNNDFSFREVHNEELFHQNGKILREVVRLFERYRIVDPSNRQDLGDLFEQLLNKGVKQNEGQFFTPKPITRFIWDCLPLKRIVRPGEGTFYPRVIDYACGAGHFLTDAVEAVNAFAHPEDNSWVGGRVFGVEKDYRLARVAKVALFMNGAGEGSIVFGDGLDNIPQRIEGGSFDILTGNPPYSVAGFKQHLRLQHNHFELLDSISNDGSEIEVLFVERIAQLLKPGGIAAVILPSSILSNVSASYTGAREHLLKNFYIRAIVQLGGKTFGATSTNTVILFLEKYQEPPKRKDMAADSVNVIFSGSGPFTWGEQELLDGYLSQIGLSCESWRRFMAEDMDFAELAGEGYFRAYLDVFNERTARKLRSAAQFQKMTSEEQDAELRRRFYEEARGREREKLFYYAMTRGQRTVIITAPMDNMGQREFLGYDWSNRKGAEGIRILMPGGKLYDDGNREAEGTLAHAVRQSFGDTVPVLTEDNRRYAAVVRTCDMLNFSRATFNKAIRPNVDSIQQITSRYPLVMLNDIIRPVKGAITRIPQSEIRESGDIRVVTQERQRLISGYATNVEPITDVPLILFGDHSCSVKYIDFPFVRGADGTQLIRPDDGKISAKYLYNYLLTLHIAEGDKYERHMKYLRTAPIPLPPMDIQLQIADECEQIDEEYDLVQRGVEELREEIKALFSQLSGEPRPLGDILELVSERISAGEIEAEHYVTTDTMRQQCRGVVPYSGALPKESIVRFQKGDILMSNIRPYLKKVWYADRDGGCSPDVLVFRSRDEALYDGRFISYIMKQDAFFDFVMQDTQGAKMPRGKKEHIVNYLIALPEPEEQKKLVKTAAGLDERIAEAGGRLRELEGEKGRILKKYLN